MAGIEIDGVNNKIDLDDDKDTSISANTDDKIVVEAGGTNTLFVNNGTVGILNEPDLGGGLHIKASDSGASANAQHDELVIENSGNSGISILSGNTSNGAICFGDDGNNSICYIDYDHNTNAMQIGVNNAAVMDIASTGNNIINCTGIDDGATGDGDFPAFTLGLKNSHANNANGIYYKNTGGSPDNANHYMILCQDSSTNRFFVQSDGDCFNHDGDFGQISDERIKQDIRDANSQWEDIKNIKIRNFKKKDDVRQYGDDAWEQIGVVAQELETVCPKLIRKVIPSAGDILSDPSLGTLDEDGNVKEVKEQIKAVGTSILYMKAVKALQEAMTRIEELETKVEALENA